MENRPPQSCIFYAVWKLLGRKFHGENTGGRFQLTVKNLITGERAGGWFPFVTRCGLSQCTDADALVVAVAVPSKLLN